MILMHDTFITVVLRNSEKYHLKIPKYVYLFEFSKNFFLREGKVRKENRVHSWISIKVYECEVYKEKYLNWIIFLKSVY